MYGPVWGLRVRACVGGCVCARVLMGVDVGVGVGVYGTSPCLLISPFPISVQSRNGCCVNLHRHLWTLSQNCTLFLIDTGSPRCTVERICRVGQNHIYIRCMYTVYIRYFMQGNHQIYGHIRCIYTVLANPTHMHCRAQMRCRA